MARGGFARVVGGTAKTPRRQDAKEAVDKLHTVHRAQVIAYLKAESTPLGLLMNFKSAVLKDGMERIIRSR